ncbi:GGDEF domain-containing protein [Aquabacterium sp.]|uniref:GGDEF domain-containing protein n=1 Tax=Aquabacterium TaxID=92793 RepID=UPI001D9AAC51|nr:GGDEF domain-containing protein [Aquabacterium sp.]MBT9610425.1 GGDEF domain-containing protein [Aquabacterium sp.]
MSPLSRASEVFPRLMMAISVIAGLAHLSFIFLFDAIGVGAMARANIASVLAYALTALLTQQGRTRLALQIMAVEILLHGSVATALIGWASGFHCYLILIIPVAIVSTSYQPRTKAVVAVLVGLFYMLMDMSFRQAQPAIEVPPHLLAGLHHFNQAATLLILGLLATLYYRMVHSAEDSLRELACTDPLTQLRNRRFAMEVAQHEAAVFQRGGRPLAVVIGDVDHFKRINDHHGHAVGDTALRAIARVLREGVREVDHVARWGGEEFLLLLPATEEEAIQVCERLRQGVQALAAQNLAGEALGVSITLGVALLQRDESIEQALARADRALYEGKQAGRNRVVLAGQDGAPVL